MKFGELLRRYRLDRCWQQLDLAVEMGVQGAKDVDRSTISHWERGKRLPGPEILTLLVRALGLDAEQERLLRLAVAREKGYLLPGHEAPFQVPRDIPYFVGREAETAHLEAALGPGQTAAICGIAGMGGIGKSAFAAHFAFVHRNLFPDGILYASLRDSDPQNVLLSFATAYGVSIPPAADLATRAAAVRTALAGKRILVILDNTEDVAAVRQVLSGCGHGNAVLVTTRDQELAAAVTSDPVLCLAVLTVEESLTLLDQLLGGGSLAEEAAARETVALLGNLPLAVEIAGRLARLRDWGIAELLTRLRNERARMQVLQVKDLQARTSFALSYEMLDETDRFLFAVMGVFRGLSFAEGAAGFIAQIPDIGQRLARMDHLSLLWSEGSSFRQHPLLADFALEKLRDAGLEDDLRKRHAHFYLDLAESNNARLKEAASAAAALQNLRNAFAHITLGYTWAIESGADEATVRYALAASDYLDGTGPFSQAVAWTETGLSAARRLDRRDWEEMLLHNLGRSYYYWGKPEQALASLQSAIEITREGGDRAEEGRCLGDLGNIYYYQGQLHEALCCYKQAAEIAHQVGNQRGEGVWLGNLALCYEDMGEDDKTIEYYQRALQIAAETGDRASETTNLGNLGATYSRLGDKRQAIAYHERAIAIAREIGNRRLEGIWLGNLGADWAALGEHTRGIEHLAQGLGIAREIGDRWGETYRLADLGAAYAQVGDLKQAVLCHEQAVAVTQELGDHWREGHSLTALGEILYLQGQHAQARAHWEKACSTLAQVADQKEPAHVLARAALGLVISDPEWTTPGKRAVLLQPALDRLQDALHLSSVPGMIQSFLQEFLDPLRDLGVEGLDPVAELIEQAMTGAGQPGRGPEEANSQPLPDNTL